VLQQVALGRPQLLALLLVPQVVPLGLPQVVKTL
jgi:hypothetical protein